VVVIERKPETYRCTACGSRKGWRQGVVVRRFRTVPLGAKRVELEARIPRLACQDCGLVRQAAVGFAEPRRSDSRSFARYVLELSRHMTIKAVATDTSPAYIDAVTTHLPGATLVFDRFHVIKLAAPQPRRAL
jgi:transposase